MKSTTTTRLALLALATTLGSLTVHAGNTWDAGGGVDTNIDDGTNWNPDGAPAFDLTQDVTFGTAGSAANFNVNGRFKSVTLNRTAAFTLGSGGGNLILRSSNSGSTYNLTVSSSIAGIQTIDCPLQIDTSNGDANKLFTFRNNRASTTQSLDINGDISLASGSTVNFNTRFDCVAGSLTRFDGAVSGLTNLQQSGGVWAGDIVFGGSKTMPSSNVSIAATGSGVGTPTTAARLFLGESPADVQSWGNITLNNTMKLVIGGTITAGNISVGGGATATNTRIVGNSATNSSLSVTGGTINDKVTVGGAGTNENNLNLVKAGTGTLTIASGTHSYTGTTTVDLGTLAVSSAASPLASSIILKPGTTLNGEGSTTGSLTFNAGTSTLNFDPATPGSFTADSVTTTGAVIVASPVNPTTVSTTYTVLTRSTGTFSGSDVAAFIPGGRGTMGGAGTNTITYTANAPAALTWKGTDGTNPTFWDVGTTFNWDNSGSDRFFTNDTVTFDDSASSYTVAIQGASVSPGDMVFNHSANYTVNGGTIVGTGSLTKSGSGTLTLAQASGTNSFGGALQINGGTLSISSLNRIGGSASTRAIELGGGTLEYTYSASNAEVSDVMPLTLNPGNSALSITGTFNGGINFPTAPVTLRLGSPITGSGNLTKSGSGIFAIGKNSVTTLGNTFDGTVTVTGGALDVRNPDSLGATTAGTSIQNAQLELFSFNQNAGVTFDPEPLTFTGNSYFRAKNEDMDSDIQYVWTGPVSVASGAVVGISAVKAFTADTVTPNTLTATSSNISSLAINAPVTTAAGSTLKLGLINPASTIPVVQSDVPQTVTLGGALTGSAAVETQGAAASVYTLTDPEYAGNTTVNGGTLSLGATNSSNDSSSVSIAATGATLNLNFAGTDTVGTLFIGGVQQPAGVYEAVGNAGSGTEIAQITGTGTLTVATGPAVSPFATWITGTFANGTVPGGQQGVNDDPDGDGATNLVEFAFDGDPTTGANNGKIHVFTVDTDHDGESANAELVLTAAVRSAVGAFTGATSKSASGDGITYTIEGSTTLGSFATQVNNVPTAVPPSPATLSSGYVWKSFSLDGSNGLPGKGFLRAKVTAP
jgi:autotransporter-associated beta strand protein